MEPRIGHAITEGFRTASRSWAGIGFFVAGWGLLLLLVGAGLAMTNPPAELLLGPTAMSRGPAGNVLPAEPTVPASTAPAGDLFKQMNTTAPMTPIPAKPATAASSSEEATQRAERAIGEWFARAWPMVLVLAFLFIAGSTWLNGGQIGYLAKRVSAGHAALAEFWTVASRAFGALLGGSLLGLAGVAALAVAWFSLVVGLIGSGRTPLVVLGLLLAAAIVAAVVWIGVRLSFWFIAIVSDRRGPLAALKASFQATRGRWWRVLWLGCLAALIGYGAVLPFALLAFLGRLAGGPLETALAIIGNVAGAIASLFVGFAILASYIRFYEDTKSSRSAS